MIIYGHYTVYGPICNAHIWSTIVHRRHRAYSGLPTTSLQHIPLLPDRHRPTIPPTDAPNADSLRSIPDSFLRSSRDCPFVRKCIQVFALSRFAPYLSCWRVFPGVIFRSVSVKGRAEQRVRTSRARISIGQDGQGRRRFWRWRLC